MVDPKVEQVVTELPQKLNKEEGFSIFKDAITGKNIIAVLGCTKSGKSALVNYLIGTPLVGERHLGRRYKVMKRNENDKGPNIGVDVVSCTAIPTLYSLEDFLLVDLPGFDDNRSQIQDVINSVYVSFVKYAAKIKFVLVFDINLLVDDNVNQFIHFLDQIQVLLKNFAQQKNSVVLVLTKDSENYSLEDVVTILRFKLLSDSNLQCNLKLISHLVETKSRLAIFKAPEGLGDITSRIDCNIKEAISTCPWSIASRKDVGVPLSLRSCNLLQTYYGKYLSGDFFYDQIRKEVDKFENLLNISDYIFASTDAELRGFLASISSVLRLCRLQNTSSYCSFDDVAAAIRTILRSINPDFQKRLEVLTGLDNWLLMNDNLRGGFIEYYKKSLARAIAIYESLTRRINSEENTRKENQESLVRYKAGTAVGGVGSVIGIALVTAAIFPVASLIGTLISVSVTAGCGVPTYQQIKKISAANQKRISARRRNSRLVTEKMFD